MKFDYQVRTKEGEVQTGIIEASSKDAAISLLQKYGFYVTYLEKESVPFYAKNVEVFKGISRRDIVLFSRQLSVMFSSKVPMVESLNVIAGQTEKPALRDIILDLSREVEGGSTLSKAMSRHEDIFSPFYISMVRSGEKSGKLTEALSYLANHLEKEYYFISSVQGAMIYPTLVLVVAIGVLLMMAFFVMPQLTSVFQQSGHTLPIVTRMVIATSAFLRKWWIVFLLFSIAFIVFFWQYIKTKEGREAFDNISLKLPLVGGLFKMVYLSRFGEGLSTLISGGLPITEALQISGDITSNSVYKKVIFQAKDAVRRGEPISSVLKLHPDIFPPIFSQMVFVGERTGTLDKALLNIVEFYQKEVNRKMDSLLSVLEPALIIFLGLVVGVIIVSVLYPLYRVYSF